jgi:hypothetical protein
MRSSCTFDASGAPFDSKSGRARERARIEHRARQQVRPGSAAFSSRRLLIVLPAAFCKLREPQRRRQPRRPAADDQHVDVECLPSRHRVFSTEVTSQRSK